MPTCPVLPPCWQRVCPPKKSNENQAVKIECDVIGVCERETFQCDDGRLICLTILQKQTSLPTTIKRKEFFFYVSFFFFLPFKYGWMNGIIRIYEPAILGCLELLLGAAVGRARDPTAAGLTTAPVRPRSRRFWRTYVQKREGEREGIQHDLNDTLSLTRAIQSSSRSRTKRYYSGPSLTLALWCLFFSSTFIVGNL